MSNDANAVIKQAAIDWFHPAWRQAEGFGGFVINQLRTAGFSVTSVTQVDDLFDTDSLAHTCPECWEAAEANAEPPYGVVEVMAAYREQLQNCNDGQARASAGLT